MDEQLERSLVAKLKRGDVTAVAPFVRAYQQRALRTAFLVTQDRALAEDATQSAFLRVVERIHQFDASRRFLPWFLRIVVNMSVQMAKQQSRILSFDEAHPMDIERTLGDLLSDKVPNPETQLEMKQLESELETLLTQLTSDQRAVIVLRYYVDLSEKEMSSVLDVPAGTVKSRLYSARRRLRQLLSLKPL